MQENQVFGMDMKDLEKILSKYYKYVLCIIFVLALILRWLYLPDKAIFFSFDQARDAFVIKEILEGHLKILGPPVSGIPGLFHGVLYYYVVAPAYYLGGGNPVITSYWMSFLNALGIFVAYGLAKIITGRKTPGIMAALIYAFSFEATQYSNLLTNASMAEWFVPITYIGLFLWITKRWKWSPILTGLSVGLAIQSELASAYHLAAILIWLIVFRKNITKMQVYTFGGSVLIAISSMIISEIKFGFTGISGIAYLLTQKDKITQAVQFGDLIVRFLNQTGETFSYTIFPLSGAFGGLIGFLIFGYAIFKESGEKPTGGFPWAKFFAIYIFSFLLALPFGGWNMRHIMVGTTIGIAAFFGVFIWKYLGKSLMVCIAILIIIVSANLYKTVKENINGQTIFSLGSDLILSKEIEIVDYTYQKAEGKPFSISTLTSPLFINTTWSYLYNWYGRDKYGYIPYWVGRDQIGQLGNNLESPPKGVVKHFFISESTFGIPELYVTYAKGDQDAMSTLVSQKSFGQIIVQERNIK